MKTGITELKKLDKDISVFVSIRVKDELKDKKKSEGVYTVREAVDKFYRLKKVFGNAKIEWKEENMSIERSEEIEVEVVNEGNSPEEVEFIETEDNSVSTIDSLSNTFNTLRQKVTAQSEEINGMANIADLGKDINDLFTKAVADVKQFHSTDQSKSFGDKMKGILGKGVSYIPLIGHKIQDKVEDVAADVAAAEVSHNSVTKNLKILVNAIKTKEEEVTDYAIKLDESKQYMEEEYNTYLIIAEQAKEILAKAKPNSRDAFKAKGLAINAMSASQEISDGINIDINPLLMNATIIIDKIQSNLPTIEARINRKTNTKIAQQSLDDLNSMLDAFDTLTNQVDEHITTSIHETSLKVTAGLKHQEKHIEMVQNKRKRNDAHAVKLKKALEDAQLSMDRTYDITQEMNNNMLIEQNSETRIFLENNSKVDFNKKGK